MPPSSEQTILGVFITHPDWLEKCDIPKGFFKTDYQQLIFREILAGAKDAGNIVQRIEKRKPGSSGEISSYISECFEGVPRTTFDGVQQMIQDVEKDRLHLQIESEFKEKPIDHEKIKRLYMKIDSLTDRKKSRAVLFNLDEVAPIPIQWLWYNKIPLGKMSLIVGDPGAGKSLLALYLAAVISRGDDWPDAKNAPGHEPGSIIILTAEDGIADTVRVRADEMKADVSRIKILEGVLPADSEELEFLDIRKHLPLIENHVREIGDVRLIVFDPITAYLGNLEGNKNVQIRSALGPLAAFSEKFNVATIGITHLNKDQAKKALYRALGSVAFTATARSVWLVQLDEDDPRKERRFFSPLKTNVCRNPTTLAFKIDGPIGLPKVTFEPNPVDRTSEELLADDETKEKYSATEEAKKWIPEALKDGRLSSNQLYKEAKENMISESSLKRAKRQMSNVISYQEKRQWFWELTK